MGLAHRKMLSSPERGSQRTCVDLSESADTEISGERESDEKSNCVRLSDQSGSSSPRVAHSRDGGLSPLKDETHTCRCVATDP